MHVPKAPGFASMLKEGAKHYAGLEEAVYRNISACMQLSKSTRSAFGPNGMNKMVINHLEKIFVTNDAATMLKELEVEHPAAKMLVFASKMQEQEAGDGTNWVLMFAGALLEHSEQLLKMGLSVPEIVDGFRLAHAKAEEILPQLVCDKVKDIRDKEEVVKAIRSSIMSKQFGNEDFIANLVAEACISILPVNSGFNVDNIRVCKIEGSGLQSSTEIELARRIAQYGETLPGLEQYSVKKFGEALEVFPITLAENAGIKSTELIAKLYAEHQYEGGVRMGYDVDGSGVATVDAMQKGILDLFLVKLWGLKFATNAASTVLKVDEIIMAKPAGGPKPQKKAGWDEDPDE